MTSSNPSIVVFDIGNVLVRWDPRNLYRKMFDDEERMEWFLAEICTMEWNVELDRGREWDEAVADLVAKHPDWEGYIRAFDERWHEMVPGPIEENVALLRRLKQASVPTYAITNFSGPKFREAQERFAFLREFDGVVVSGDERLLKPDAEIFELFLRRYELEAGECIFIDDSAANVRTAQALGMHAIHFVEPMDLSAVLRQRGIEAA